MFVQEFAVMWQGIYYYTDVKKNASSKSKREYLLDRSD